MARILVVDDEPDVRELFNITLKMAGHETDTAKHGQEALDRLATESPDLIVLDLMMPHVDGFSFLAHVRGEMSTKPMRVLVATAKVLEDADQERLGDWPVVGVLNKGELDIGQMVMVVTTALSKSPLKVEAAATPEPEKAETTEVVPVKPTPEATSTPSQPAVGKPTTAPPPQPSDSPSFSSTSPSADSAAGKSDETSDKRPSTDAKPEVTPAQPQQSSGETGSSSDKPTRAAQKDISTKPLSEEKAAPQPPNESKDSSEDKPVVPKSAP
ncbi:MAG: response regulator [Anaerolineae bacterium]|nr:response regulator [Anaerolineae bacterium]